MKMKKIIYVLFILTLVSIAKDVYASKVFYVTLTNNDVVIRKGPSTGYSKLTNVSKGEIYYLKDENVIKDEKMNGSCDAGWWHVNYNGNSGYICSKYATKTEVEADDSCETNLTNLGFPSDYVTSLCALKQTHPNWSFVPLITNLEWSTAVAKESACGKSYIETSNPDYIDTSCKSAYSSTSSWKVASSTAVAYYMDPRNWLSEKTIFQFNTNKYEASLSNTYVALATNTIKGTEFYKYHLGIKNDLGQIINQAGKDTNVSPIFLSSRMVQELGSKTSLYNLYSGVYTGNSNEYYGYYNFYNIGVTDACANKSGTTYCGLSYAKSKGWSSPLLAIKGGSSSISSGYINAGQYTTYLQKFNVTPVKATSLYAHQYMTNIAAPSSESKTAYNTYKNAGVLESEFVFYIPVYKNMGASINNIFNGATTDPNEKEEETKSEVSVPTMVTSAGYSFNNNVIGGIEIGTSATELKGALESVAGSGNVVIKDKEGKEVKDVVGTGSTIQITNKSGVSSITIVVKGDTSGDGKVNVLDLLQIQKDILNMNKLKDIYKTAADTSGDGKINVLDLLQIQKEILGIGKIKQ